MPRYNKTGRQKPEPAPRHVTHICDQSLTAQQYITLRRSHGQVTKVHGQAPHITTEYSADSRYRTTRARVCLHIQKPKSQATIKNEIVKIHKLFDVYNTINTQTMMGVGQLRWQCYRRHQQNPQPCPDSVVLAGDEKKKSTLSHVLKGEEWVTGRSGLRLWL